MDIKDQKNLTKRRAEILLESFVKRNEARTPEMLEVIAQEVQCPVEKLNFSIESVSYVLEWVYRKSSFDYSIEKHELPDWSEYKPYFSIKRKYSVPTVWSIDFLAFYTGKVLLSLEPELKWGIHEIFGARGDYVGRWEPSLFLFKNERHSEPLITRADNIIRVFLTEKRRFRADDYIMSSYVKVPS